MVVLFEVMLHPALEADEFIRKEKRFARIFGGGLERGGDTAEADE